MLAPSGMLGPPSSIAMTRPSTSTLIRRLTAARDALGSLGLDALIVTCSANIRYLSNHVGSAGILVVTRDAVQLLVDSRYSESVRVLQESPAACPGLRMWQVPGCYDEALVACVEHLAPAAAGFEAAHLSVARYEWLRAALDSGGAHTALRATQRVVERARVIKDAEEIATLHEAAARLSAVAQSAFDAVRPGVTERHVAGAIEAALRDQGYERPAFDTIVASGPQAAWPHHRADDRVLAPGDVVVLDFGGVYDGYCSDLTRTVSVGPPTQEARRVHAAVCDAQRAAIAVVRPGIETAVIDAAAREILESRGLGEAFGHGTGHGLGLNVHEEPRISRLRTDMPSVLIETGMVFTIEPGAYLAGWGGVRIEDDVLVTETGCEVLTSVSRELLACG